MLSIFLVVLLSSFGHCLKCHKCIVTRVDFRECPNLKEGAVAKSSKTIYYDIEAFFKNKSAAADDSKASLKLPVVIPSSEDYLFCEDADACYLKESTYKSIKHPWAIEAGCFGYKNPRFGDFLARAFKKKSLVCDSTRKDGEHHRVCYCNTDLCNFARKQALVNNRDILDYAKWYSHNNNSIIYQSFSMIAWLNLIVKLIM